MNKKSFGVLGISILAVAVAIPLFAMTIRLRANVPFEFAVGDKTLPAGEYSISTGSNQSVVQLQGFQEHIGAMSLTNRTDVRGQDLASATKLVFHRYGDRYFLSGVYDGYDSVGMELPVSHAERELTRTASAQAPEIVAVLARR